MKTSESNLCALAANLIIFDPPFKKLHNQSDDNIKKVDTYVVYKVRSTYSHLSNIDFIRKLSIFLQNLMKIFLTVILRYKSLFKNKNWWKSPVDFATFAPLHVNSNLHGYLRDESIQLKKQHLAWASVFGQRTKIFQSSAMAK